MNKYLLFNHYSYYTTDREAMTDGKNVVTENATMVIDSSSLGMSKSEAVEFIEQKLEEAGIDATVHKGE